VFDFSDPDFGLTADEIVASLASKYDDPAYANLVHKDFFKKFTMRIAS